MSNHRRLFVLVGLCFMVSLWDCKSSKSVVETPNDACEEFKQHWETYVHYIPTVGRYYLADTLAEWADPKAIKQYKPSDTSGEPATRFEMWTSQLMKKCFIGKTPKEVIGILGPPSRYLRGRAHYEVACHRRTDFCLGNGGVIVDTSAKVIGRVEGGVGDIQILP